jgi:hypothetical protein
MSYSQPEIGNTDINNNLNNLDNLDNLDNIFNDIPNNNIFDNLDDDYIFQDTIPRNDTSHIFAGTRPISSYPVIDTVIDNALVPEIFRMKFYPDSTNPLDIYGDTIKLIEELESRMSNTNFTLDSNQTCGKRNITKFVNDQLAMRLLQLSFKYMKIVGENTTLQHLLNHMKPFDGSLSQVLADKELEIKQLRTELDLYKLKTKQTYRQMVELRKVYEIRRLEDLNKLKEQAAVGNNIMYENKVLISEIKKIKKKSKYDLKHAISEINYQKTKKHQARFKYFKLLNITQKQLNSLINENDILTTQNKNIENRMNHLTKSRFQGLNKHFKDLFPKKDIVGTCSLCYESIFQNDMFICSNQKCKIMSHKQCLLKISSSKCQFCQTNDVNLKKLHDDNVDTNLLEHPTISSSQYESDDDEEYNYDVINTNSEQGHDIIYRTIDEFQQAMFNTYEDYHESQELNTNTNTNSDSDEDDTITNYSNDDSDTDTNTDNDDDSDISDTESTIDLHIDYDVVVNETTDNV